MKHLLIKWVSTFAFALFALLILSTPPLLSVANASQLHAAIVPNEIERLVFDPFSNTEQPFYATIINDSDVEARSCRIALRGPLPFALRFWTTDPDTNQIIGQQDNPVNIAPRSSQSFLFTLDLESGRFIPEQRVGFVFDCETHQSAAQVSGVNDLLLSAGARSVLLSIATPDEENRLILNNQFQEESCSINVRGESVPCAVGVLRCG